MVFQKKKKHGYKQPRSLSHGLTVPNQELAVPGTTCDFPSTDLCDIEPSKPKPLSPGVERTDGLGKVQVHLKDEGRTSWTRAALELDS